ncbi:MAG: GSCFA domain-containing protein [Hyphomicrobiaceae bacterium]
MGHPYLSLPASAFWRRAISETSPLELKEIYRPKFTLDKKTRIVAAGSCFAQHIGRQFKQRGYNFVDAEPPPPMLPRENWRQFGYDTYSARYGNVYSARQLLQLVEGAMGHFTPHESVWINDGRFYDPFRPSVEPDGFTSEEEVRCMRKAHLAAVAAMLADADVFVFTFGLTEAWTNTEDGAVYPTCPGTIAGTFDSSRHKFVNFTVSDVVADTRKFIALARTFNPRMRFLFTVSPVPLTATASGWHVLPATVTQSRFFERFVASFP